MPFLLDQYPAVSEGSTVLVTGVNGLIGSHVANEFLERGYNVRGTVRNMSKSAWIKDLFVQQYGKDRFSLVPVVDLTSPHAQEEAVKGVAAVIHVASPLGGGTNTEGMITEAVASAVNALKAANRESSVKRFVLTSSSTAAVLPRPDVNGIVVTEDTWNDEAVAASHSTADWYTVYAASKTEAERAVWNFYHNDRTRRSDLIVNTEYFVDVQDTARLHVAGAILSDVQGERIFAWAEPFNFDSILAVLHRQNPKKSFVENFHSSQDLADVGKPRSRAIELLQALGKSTFTSLEDSIRLNTQDLA
ncbi:hypothetical protein NW762_009327 [Fusarium torreyae]|uniref:NAD-dependent epimerase/dehydratase domain-containing protein n=1 Tax=Fusarium torreyae TaxID=1237075 RepID=A0A9W8RXX0_9HYPO|nr:hypothetical protein NW762_009327 [Fusarium torreyae]